MKTPDRVAYGPPPVTHQAQDDKHFMDYVRVIYKRRWIALPVFLILFVIGAINAFRETPIYQASVQLLIQKDAPKVASLDQLFEGQDSSEDDFIQTQFRILQSRTLARKTLDALNLWSAPRLGNGPEEHASISFTGLVGTAAGTAIELAKKPFTHSAPPAPVKTEAVDDALPETTAQSERIDEFLGGLAIVPVRGSQIAEIRYSSTDPIFAAQAANTVAKAYIEQNLESKFNTSKEATDWLSDRLTEQRKAVEASEAALQAYKEQNGGVSIVDGGSNIVVQRLTDLNSALTKAKTERFNKEAAYNQLKSAEVTGALDTMPAVLANDYIQKLRTDLSDLQRQQAQLAERYGERHAEMIKIRGTVQTAEAKLKAELGKVVESAHSEYQAASSEEQNLQSALDAQKGEALSMNRKGIEYGVLQREAESNRQIYDALMQRTKETGISGELKRTNVRVVDAAETPRSPISPNVSRELTVSFAMSLFFACGIAFFFEYLDSRIKSPQELKAYLAVPFLGMVPSIGKVKEGDPMLSSDVPANFGEAFKAIRTNVLFSSAEEGMRSLVVTSSGPGEGKSVISANLAIALAQAGQRVLLMDADMRRPRVHEIFGTDQEPGLSNVLTGNAKASEAIRRSTSVHGLWLLSSGHIPPNPAELLGSHRYRDFMGSLDEHFDWVVVDSPPVLVVTDGAIVANQASGVVFVVSADKTSRHAARAAVDQLNSANAHIIGSVLNRVDLQRHPYYYSSYYRKEYAKYYVSSSR
jgi:capsular exopolysaccharide synthesis family protein